MDYPHRNILFTTTEDGVDIAFWEIGEGKPVVIIQNFGLSHAELEWTTPSLASFYTEMAERYRVIRFDPRGIGTSGDRPDGWETPRMFLESTKLTRRNPRQSRGPVR